MAKGQRLKPEQIVTLLRQIDDLTTNRARSSCALRRSNTINRQTYFISAQSNNGLIYIKLDR